MQKFSLTELTDRLQGPDSAHVQKEVMEQLMSLHDQVEARLKGGAKPSEFDDYEKIKSAVSSAISVLKYYMK